MVNPSNASGRPRSAMGLRLISMRQALTPPLASMPLRRSAQGTTVSRTWDGASFARRDFFRWIMPACLAHRVVTPLPEAIAWLGGLPQSIAVVRSPANVPEHRLPGIDTCAPLREDLERAPACARDRCGKPLPESRASIVRSTTRRGEWDIPTAFSRRHQPDVATEPIILWPVGNRREVHGLRSCVWRGSERDSGLQMDQHRPEPRCR
jgi:hypothetical protein